MQDAIYEPMLLWFDNAPPPDDWTRCADGLPALGQRVWLVYMRNNHPPVIRLGYRIQGASGSWHWSSHASVINPIHPSHVTHWRPVEMPAMPEEVLA